MSTRDDLRKIGRWPAWIRFGEPGEKDPDDYLGALIVDDRTDAPELQVRLWDTGRYRDGKAVLRYELAEGGEVIFAGEDFYPSPQHAVDAPETFAGIAGFLSLRPGDTDDDYFASYTPRQVEFAEQRAEGLACAVAELEEGAR